MYPLRMTSPLHRTAFPFVLLSLALALSACGRASITFSLNPQPAKLDETTVMGDEGASAKVALIDVRGLIVDAQQRGLLTPGQNPVDELAARLEKARRDPELKAVVLRMNSPGGSVTASDIMYNEVRRFREQTGKPVVVSMGEVAASGGYYVSLAGDRILAQPTTITGSIGVIIPTVNVSQGLNSIGIFSRSVKSGANKDLANPLEPMRDSQYVVLQHMVDEFYSRFRGLVMERRGSQRADGASTPDPADYLAAHADELMDGRILTGSEAARFGLVDAEGDLRDAFDEAKRLAKLASARLVKYHDDGDSVRSAYALNGTNPANAGANRSQSAGAEFNFLQVNLGDGVGAGLISGGNAYYLWTLGVP